MRWRASGGRQIDQATEVLIRTVPGEDEEEVKFSLIGMGIQEEIKTWHDLLGKAFAEVVQSYGVINSISTIVSIVIAIVVIFIVIMIKTLNNRRQIGILKAIGIHRTTITFSYVFQVIILAVMGIIFGLFILFALDRYFAVYPIVFPDGDIRPAFTLADIVIERCAPVYRIGHCRFYSGMADRPRGDPHRDEGIT